MPRLTITYDATDEEAAAVQAVLARRNAENQEQLTVAQFLQEHLRHKVRHFVAKVREERTATRRALLEQATAADVAAVDAILDKYRV